MPALSLRERKKRATRDALQRAALALVGSAGVEAVTVEDIAAAADVSPRTFFNYFPTKEDAIIGWDPSILAETVDRLRRRPTEEPAPKALRTALLEVLASLEADHRHLLDCLRVIRSDPQLLAHYTSRWSDTERQLVAALAERRGTDPRHDHYVSLVVATTLSATRVALMSWCDGGGRTAIAEELAAHLNVLALGLAEPEGVLP